MGKKGLQAIKHMMLREEHYGLGTLYSFDCLKILPKQGINYVKCNNYYIEAEK